MAEEISLRAVEGEIMQARALLSSAGRFLREDGEIRFLLGEYRKAIQSTQLLMAQEGVARACGICDEGTTRGGCCFPGVEDWYDSILLAINLLLEREMPTRFEVPDACLFAGPRGCKLLARHSFCINYFCRALKLRLQGEPLKRLNAAAGRELLCGWQLERTIRTRLGLAFPPP